MALCSPNMLALRGLVRTSLLEAYSGQYGSLFNAASFLQSGDLTSAVQERHAATSASSASTKGYQVKVVLLQVCDGTISLCLALCMPMRSVTMPCKLLAWRHAHAWGMGSPRACMHSSPCQMQRLCVCARLSSMLITSCLLHPSNLWRLEAITTHKLCEVMCVAMQHALTASSGGLQAQSHIKKPWHGTDQVMQACHNRLLAIDVCCPPCSFPNMCCSNLDAHTRSVDCAYIPPRCTLLCSTIHEMQLCNMIHEMTRDAVNR